MADTNLEDVLEQLQFNYGGVLQKLAELHDEVVGQMEMLKTAGTKIRRRNTSYAKDTVLVCVGRNNGNKFLKCKTAGTTSDVQWTEATYTGFDIGSTVTDGTVVWEIMETAFTSGTIVQSASSSYYASNANYANFAGHATEAEYAASAGYVGPFHVIQGSRVESQVVSSGSVSSAYDGYMFTIQDDTRPIGIGGHVVVGNSTIPLGSCHDFLADDKILYLFGSSSPSGSYFDYGFYMGNPPELGPGQFLTALAKNQGGKIVQMQFGDVVQPFHNEEVGEYYNGPFKVFITGSTTTTSGSEEVTHYNFELYDPTSPINSSTNKHEWGGKVFAGETYKRAGITSGSVRDGDTIYLVGDSKNGTISFDYTNYIPVRTSDGADTSAGRKTITDAGFYVRIAECHGDTVTQVQHGDITVPPWKVESAVSASIADFANSANLTYSGPFDVITLSSQVVSETVSSGGSQIVTSSTKFIVRAQDDTREENIAGAIVFGNYIHICPWSRTDSITVREGQKLYLIGELTSEGISVVYSATASVPSNLEPTVFWTQLAYNDGARMIQTQFGDIVQPWRTYSPIKTSSYIGPFYVGSQGPGIASGSINVRVCDITDSRTGSDFIAGKVFDGETLHEIPAIDSLDVPNGGYVYLVGTAPYSSDNIHILTSGGSNTASSFSVRLATNKDGVIEQIQFGDIYSIPYNATNARFASRAEYHGPFHVSAINDSTVKIYDDSRPATYGGCVVVGSRIEEIGSGDASVVNGESVYLVGTSVYDGTISCHYEVVSAGQAINPAPNTFWTQLAHRSAGVIIQTQYGDVVEPFYNPQEYEGPFKVIITGSTQAEGATPTTKYQFTVIDPTAPIVQLTEEPEWIGKVHANSSSYDVVPADISIDEIDDGDFVYLIGTSDSDADSATFSITNELPSIIPENTFYTRLAKNEGGTIKQIQYGDITEVPWGITGTTVTTLFEYEGPFKASIAGSTDEGGTTTYSVNISDSLSTVTSHGGWIFDGNTRMEVVSSSVSLSEGESVYVTGTTGSDPIITETEGTNNSSSFSIQIAKIVDGQIKQIQFGDVYSIPWNALKAKEADYASSAGYVGPFMVELTNIDASNNATVKIYDPADSTYAGRVFDGANLYTIDSSTGFSLSNNSFVYLNGDYGSQPVITSSAGSNTSNSFSIKLAKNEGGKIIQLQYGNVYSIPWNAYNADYFGPFMVTGGIPDANNAIAFEIFDPSSPLDVNNKHTWAGKVFAGKIQNTVGCNSGTLADSESLYLIGSFVHGDSSATFSYGSQIPNPVTSGMFYTRLAKNEGGKIIQLQYGDITVPPWDVDYADSADLANSATTADNASSATFASYYAYRGPFYVSVTGGTDTTVQINGGLVYVTTGNTYSSVTISGSSVNRDNAGANVWMVVSRNISGNLVGSFTSTPSFNVSTYSVPLASYDASGNVTQYQFGDVVITGRW